MPTLLALALPLAGCGGGASKVPTVDDPWIRLPAVPGRPAAGYFTITGGSEPRRLVAVESPQAKKVEMHQSSTTGGRTTMRRLDGVDLANGETATFTPGGNHLMIFGLSPVVRPGDRMRLSFRFEKGQPVTRDARVVAASDEGL